MSGGHPQGRAYIRRFLVVIQFFIAVVLILAAITVYRQYAFVMKKPLGYNPQQVVLLPSAVLSGNYPMSTLKKAFQRLPGVLQVATASRAPGQGYRLAITYPEGNSDDEPFTMHMEEVDEDYLGTLGMTLAAGRNFRAEVTTDQMEAILINQTAARSLGWDNPLGKTIRQGVRTDTGVVMLERRVIGVVKDYHQQSLHNPITPIIIGNLPQQFSTLIMRIAPDPEGLIMADLQQTWAKLEPDRPFNFHFLEDMLIRHYAVEVQLRRLVLNFSLLAVLIACMGLLGLATFTLRRRTKELGIRKVLGAGNMHVILLISREYFLLIMISGLLAIPMAVYLLNRWLENFAYRVDISILTVVLGLSLIVIIAALAVGVQTWRAARTNPVDSLRYE